MTKNEVQLDSKKRFSDRVDDYVKYRPSYPPKIIEFLTKEQILNKNSILADVGSGTGFLTKIFLENGNKVYGVEPNQEMREAGESYLQQYDNFQSINGSSEQTTLPDHSIDLILAGQAYHWFNRTETAKEFKRILKDLKKENIILIWNNRTETTDFNKSYEQLIQKYSNKTIHVDQKKDEKIKAGIFFDKKFNKEVFYNEQILSLEELRGRILSSSYMIKKTDKSITIFDKDLEKLFQKYEQNGKVILTYDTELFYGNISS